MLSHSFLATLLDFLLWSSLGNWLLLLSRLVDLLLGSFLFLHLLSISLLKKLLGGVQLSISLGVIFGSSSLDFVEAHTNDGSSNFLSSSGSFLLDVFDLYFLVESSGSLCPSELHRLDSLEI